MMFDAHALRPPLDPLNLLCDHGHVYALADALPADVLEALAEDRG